MSENSSAILFAAYGTTHADAADVYEKVREAIEARAAGREVLDCFTSERVRQTLEEQGIKVKSPGEAVRLLRERAIHKLFVQSLHVVAGEEYHRMIREVRAEAHELELSFSPPLMDSCASIRQTAQILLGSLPEDRNRSEPCIWVGHGHPEGHCDSVYMALAAELQKRDPLVFVGTLNTLYTPAEILGSLPPPPGTVWVLPLLGVAGVHTGRELAGNTEHSWRTELFNAGYTPRNLMSGLLDNPEILNLWLRAL